MDRQHSDTADQNETLFAGISVDDVILEFPPAAASRPQTIVNLDSQLGLDINCAALPGSGAEPYFPEWSARLTPGGPSIMDAFVIDAGPLWINTGAAPRLLALSGMQDVVMGTPPFAGVLPGPYLSESYAAVDPLAHSNLPRGPAPGQISEVTDDAEPMELEEAARTTAADSAAVLATSRLPTQNDWEEHKFVIRNLYFHHNLNLNDVIKIMNQRHKFRAT